MGKETQVLRQVPTSLYHPLGRITRAALYFILIVLASWTTPNTTWAATSLAPELSAAVFSSYSSNLTAPDLNLEYIPVVEPDWTGVSVDTGVLFVSQFLAVGIVYVMPESVSGWSKEQKRESFRKYRKNVGHPVMDHDKFYINYILHPYWGATYYTRARERNLGPGASFAFSTVISAMYEFGVESFFERPSIQDLIVTPIAGSVLGAYVFEPVRDSIKRKQETRWYDDTIMVITDPIGVLSSAVERVTGRKPTVKLQYAPQHLQRITTTDLPAQQGDRVDLLFEFPMK